ncbi:MAG: transposase [Candidatus Cloacimonadaceae bacterium]|nr:transposase [Candidatus Cloacimonadaceae bacterium]MDP3113542.1 transposase [Candidatus Cloacimonadaceae bacterium]
MSNIIENHKGRLPHFLKQGQIISLTWRLAFTLPKPLLFHYQDLREMMKSWGNDLDSAQYDSDQFIRIGDKLQEIDLYLGKCSLKGISLTETSTALILTTAFHYYNDRLYELHAYCVMSNHVHLMIKPLKENSGMWHKTSEIVKKIKTYSAKEINKVMNHSGTLWAHEYFDRFIRSPKHYYHEVEYILDNPVKAGLVKDRSEWRNSYYHPGLIE